MKKFCFFGMLLAMISLAASAQTIALPKVPDLRGVNPVKVDASIVENRSMELNDDARFEAVGFTAEPREKSQYKALDNNWVSLGTAKYTDDFIDFFFGIGNPTFDVEIEENTAIPGFYRLVAPFEQMTTIGGWYSDTGNTYMYIHAENPEQVYIEMCYTGYVANKTYGEVVISSLAYIYKLGGKTDAEIAQAGFFGTLEDGIITFPIKSLCVAMVDYKEGNFYFANQNGAFKTVVPGGKNYTVTAQCLGCAHDGDWTFAVSKSADVATTRVSWLVGDWPASQEMYSLLDEYGEGATVAVNPGTYNITLDCDDEELLGRYTFYVLGYNAAGKLCCGDATYFYVFRDDADEWESLGYVEYGEDLIGSFYNCGPTVCHGELQEKIDEPGYYRLVNAYQGDYILATQNRIRCNHNHYIYIDATWPDQVILLESPIGMDLGYGFISINSLANYNGDDARLGDMGVLASKDENWKAITFPVGKILMAESNASHGKWFAANVHNAFFVNVPKAEIEDFDWTFELPETLVAGEAILLDAESPIDTEVTYAVENMQELTEVNLLAEGLPVAEIVETEDGMALKINRNGSFDLVVTVAGDEDFRPLRYVQNLVIDTLSGVALIEAPKTAARYFNLQGVEIAEPAEGICIRLAAGHAEKVIK